MLRARINLLLCLAAVAAAFVPDLWAQDRAYVRVVTNHPQAILYADSTVVGIPGDAPMDVPPETRSLRLILPDVNSWSIAPVVRSVELAPGDTIVASMYFAYHYRVESTPFGADVLVEDDAGRRTIGQTPLLYRSKAPLKGRLAVQAPGYAIERREPGSEIWNRHVVRLQPSDDLDPTTARIDWHPPKKHRAWIDYAVLGAAAAAGVLAVHYKFRADGLYAEYEETRDPGLRSSIESYDVRAGVAFGAMQAGLGIFAVRLILR